MPAQQGDTNGRHFAAPLIAEALDRPNLMMGPKTTELVTQLDELDAVLRELDHEHWANWVAESARRLRGGDFSGITHLLDAYGGMGSLNDILPQTSTGDDRIDRARRLRSDAWRLADEIRKEAVVE